MTVTCSLHFNGSLSLEPLSAFCEPNRRQQTSWFARHCFVTEWLAHDTARQLVCAGSCTGLSTALCFIDLSPLLRRLTARTGCKSTQRASGRMYLAMEETVQVHARVSVTMPTVALTPPFAHCLSTRFPNSNLILSPSGVNL